MVCGLVITLCAIGILAALVLMLIYDYNANTQDNKFKLNLAPYSVVEYTIGKNSLNVDEVTIQLDPGCMYSGLIQVAARLKSTRTTNSTIRKKFRKIVRYWPRNISVKGNIMSENATKISWTWKSMHDSDTDDVSLIENECEYEHTIDHHMDIANITRDRGKNEDVVTITACEDDVLLSADFIEEVANVNDMHWSNLAIGEDGNSTTVLLDFSHHRQHLYLSTKYVQITDKKFDQIVVGVELTKSGILWKISAGLSSSIIITIFVLVLTCLGIRHCRQREFEYFTIMLRSLKIQEHQF